MKLSGPLVAAVAAALLVSTACSGSDDQPATAKPDAPRSMGAADVSCPAVPVDHQRTAAFRPAGPGGPHLVADLVVHDLGHRDYCVQPESDDTPATATKIVSYSVVLPSGSNYGERYGTFDRKSSDELLNFPFDFHVYGKCRPVHAEIVVRTDGAEHTYRAETQVGPECPGR